MRLLNNFLNLVKINSTADPNSGVRPSTSGQNSVRELVVSLLENTGVGELHVGNDGILYTSIPATKGCEDLPSLGFLAHMDTSDALSADTKPLIHNNYDGGVICFENGDRLDPDMFKDLKNYVGETLITTDGTSVLGADDKAGVAEIIELIYIIKERSLAHPTLYFAFSTDEEIGCGMDEFDLSHFGAKYAYTVDGGESGSIEYETFNAASATITFNGVSVHTGTAKGILVNSADIAAEFAVGMPKDDKPEKTEKYEGFFHLQGMKGDVTHTVLSYLVRDHDKTSFENRKSFIEERVAAFNKTYGDGTVIADVKDSYYNMSEVINEHYHLVENAIKAVKNCGYEEKVEPVRGGTDGARLSFMGIPCPNLGTGGHCFHGQYEHITAEAMQRSVNILVEIVNIYASVKV